MHVDVDVQQLWRDYRDQPTVELRNHQTIARHMRYHAFAFEPAHGIAHRRAADFEPGGDFDFHDALTRLQCAGLNRVTQPVIGEFAARAVGCGGHRQRRWAALQRVATACGLSQMTTLDFGWLT